MNLKSLQARSPGVASTVCLYVACTPIAMSVLGLNFEAPAACFTSKFLKNIKFQGANLVPL